MLKIDEISSQKMLYDPSVPPVDRAPILVCPSSILVLIGCLLPNQDAINFTSVCTQLFNLRFEERGHGILHAQCWSRMPKPNEIISSKIIFPDWQDREGGRMLRNDTPGLTALTIDYHRSPHLLNTPNANAIAERLKQLSKLTALRLNCYHFQVEEILLLLERVMQAIQKTRRDALPFFDLTLFGLSEQKALPIFKKIELFRNVQSVNIQVDHLFSFPVDLCQLIGLQSLTLKVNDGISFLPGAINQLTNLRHLSVHAPALTAMPPEVGQLECLQRLTISGKMLVSLPAELGQLRNLQSLTIDADLRQLPLALFELRDLQHLTLISRQRETSPEYRPNHSDSLPAELGQFEHLQSLTINDRWLTALPAALSQLCSLKSFALTAERLTDFPAGLHGFFDGLQDLEVEGRWLSYIFTNISTLSGLQSLTINADNLSSLPIGLGQLKYLQSLTIRSDSLQFLPIELGQLECLQNLVIQAKELTFLPVQLWQLTRLRNVTIIGHTWYSIPLTLANLNNLQNLTITLANEIAFAELLKFGALRSLQSLTLWSRYYGATFREKIQQLNLPGVRIRLET